jgi:phosphoadenosine phosphosulfate reductase
LPFAWSFLEFFFRKSSKWKIHAKCKIDRSFPKIKKSVQKKKKQTKTKRLTQVISFRRITFGFDARSSKNLQLTFGFHVKRQIRSCLLQLRTDRAYNKKRTTKKEENKMSTQTMIASAQDCRSSTSPIQSPLAEYRRAQKMPAYADENSERSSIDENVSGKKKSPFDMLDARELPMPPSLKRWVLLESSNADRRPIAASSSSSSSCDDFEHRELDVDEGEDVVGQERACSIALSADHLAFLNERLASLSVDELLRWCALTLPNLAQVTSFGPSGMVIMERMHALGIRVPVIFLDTLHHFDETLAHAESASARFDLDVRVYRCRYAHTQQQFVERFKEDCMYERDVELYDWLVKVEPLERALRELKIDAWLTGRRRSQGGERTAMPILEFDESDGRLKINPLAHHSAEDIWQAIRDRSIPYNPLHDQGYKSVGDRHATVPVTANEDERSGRWQGDEEKTECGIHNRPRRNNRRRRRRHDKQEEQDC